MEKDLPPFEPYRGPSRPGDFLHNYVQSQAFFHGDWNLGTPRFRIGDARNNVRDLIRAAAREKFKDERALAPLERWPDIKSEEARGTGQTLAWFDGLSEADAAHFFPRGPDSADTMRRNFTVEAFDKALALHERMAQSRLTRFRIWALFIGREIFGDSSLFMPNEVAHFIKFRKGDSLRDIQTLASGYAQEAFMDTYPCEGGRLHHLMAELGRTEGPFDKIAWDITGLDKRHKDDMHSTGDLY